MEKQKKHEKRAYAIAKLFQTELGQEVLEELRKKFDMCTIASPQNEPAQAYFNEGRRDVYKFILSCIRKQSKNKET